MSGHPVTPGRKIRQTLEELRRHSGLFSFRNDIPDCQFIRRKSVTPELGIGPGGIVECLVARHGAGALTATMQIMAQSFGSHGFWAVIDSARELFVPALSGWGFDSSKAMLIRPQSRVETCWAIEECLRCPGISATWAWVDEKIPTRVHRRWQLAAEFGRGVGLFFRPLSARKQPVWAELRLLITPMAGAQEETRRLNIEVLYRRGGKGGSAQTWEIDHAAGLVRLVPEVAHPEVAMRKARA